jgi:sugar phosphate isomerase/epimerase
MLYSGLVSITFRQLLPEEIVDLVRQAGLQAIEWGGDVHAPHGDLDRAAEVRRMTEAAGLAISAYGSYYRVGESEDEGLSFADVLATASALGAPAIRVWAGRQASATAAPAYRAKVVAESRRIATMSAAHRISVAYEYHGQTLTDANESAMRLLEEVDHPNLFTFWQPPNQTNQATRMAGLEAILPKLTNIHVFYWESSRNRFPLAEGASIWLPFLQTIRRTGRDHYASLEFVQNDDLENFLRDAETLKGWLQQVNQP